jgi:hypothetical protein
MTDDAKAITNTTTTGAIQKHFGSNRYGHGALPNCLSKASFDSYGICIAFIQHIRKPEQVLTTKPFLKTTLISLGWNVQGVKAEWLAFGVNTPVFVAFANTRTLSRNRSTRVLDVHAHLQGNVVTMIIQKSSVSADWPELVPDLWQQESVALIHERLVQKQLRIHVLMSLVPSSTPTPILHHNPAIQNPWIPVPQPHHHHPATDATHADRIYNPDNCNPILLTEQLAPV